MNLKLEFGKDKTLIIKGVAIISMMLHHCYGKGNYLVEVDFGHAPLSHVNDVFKICVGIFVFMVGYGYNFSKAKDWKYSYQHIKKLLIPFWTILLFFTVPLCYKEFYSSGWITIMYNLVGIDIRFNYYSWFVYFFIYAMIVMPFISRFIDKRPLLNTILAVIGSYLLEVAVHSIPGVLENKPHLALFNCFFLTPGMVLGYYFAHDRIYQKINLRVSKSQGALLGVSLMILPLIPRYYHTAILCFQLDFFYAPIFILGVLILFSLFKLRYIRYILLELGGVSVYMWFFHALFYTHAVSWFYQPAITIFSDINLVVLWAITFSFFSAKIISYIVSKIKLN